MNFIEAIFTKKEVKRSGYSSGIILKNGIIVWKNTGNSASITERMLRATDWEIVEDKETLVEELTEWTLENICKVKKYLKEIHGITMKAIVNEDKDWKLKDDLNLCDECLSSDILKKNVKKCRDLILQDIDKCFYSCEMSSSDAIHELVKRRFGDL